ncbi:MAG TPA: S8 family peptidase [Flavobacterium sp.]|jgi:subtilisin family serine protease
MRIITPIVAAIFATTMISGYASAQSSISLSAPTVKKNYPKKATLKETELQRWSHLDLAKDTVPGMSVDRAYAELLKGKKGQTVIVGVIDSGVDIEHEDLKSVIWINPKEKANGKDDDNNGYIDDINGWNFLGDANNEALEMTRIVAKGDDGSAEFKRAKADFDKQYQEALAGKQQMEFITNVDAAIKAELKKSTYTAEDLKNLNSQNPMINQVKPRFIQILGQMSKGEFDEQIQEGMKHYSDQLAYNLNVDFNGRKVVGDNPEDLKDRKYGNNNVVGPDKEEALHGTHVAGIIAQVRNNNVGGDGVANNAQIMVLRAVPNGDEYDKDIALAIRYAVDNGAKVINGSFGKSFSPHKDWVFDAIKYAASKDVLFVHAAGNDGHDIDLEQFKNFPNDSENAKTEISDNVITIGALNPTLPQVVAPFSNYGSYNVDVFAPGVQIYATVPGSKYRYLQGTSMASPNVAGVAALIRSYYPKLSAAQVKKILMESGTPLPETVAFGEEAEQREFAGGSRSGKMVNAYNALKMAEQMSGK